MGFLYIWICWNSRLTHLIVSFTFLLGVRKHELLGKGVVGYVAQWSAFTIHKFPPMTNRGWMVKQVAVKLAICDAVCSFNMRIQGVIIRWEVDRTLFLNFLPLGSLCLPASSSCTFLKDAGQYKSLHISSDTILQVNTFTNSSHKSLCLGIRDHPLHHLFSMAIELWRMVITSDHMERNDDLWDVFWKHSTAVDKVMLAFDK